MGNGWIKLHRKIEDSIIFSNEKGLKVWIWCLLRAGHKEKSIFLGRNKIVLLPGQFVTGSNTMEEELNLGKSTIWYWLRILEKEGQVGIKTTNKYSVITIPNWDRYQEVGNKEEADGEQMGTNKNDKKEKNLATGGEITESTFTEEEREPRRSAPKFPNARVAFNWFPNRQKSWDLNTTELKHGELLFERGEESVRGALGFAAKHQDYEDIPQILKPSDLERKWNELIAFAKRNGL